MATKRGDKSRNLELADFPRRAKKDYIEKVVLANDTLQGIALLYNTTVADLKKLNHLHNDIELHAHRIIKVPSKGILVNLEPESVPVFVSTNEEEEEDQEEDGLSYLNNVDANLKEIREKAESAAANSVVNGDDDPPIFRKAADRNQGELKWWKLFIPCLGTLIIFPILYFIYRQHLHDHYSVPFSNPNHSMHSMHDH